MPHAVSVNHSSTSSMQTQIYNYVMKKYLNQAPQRLGFSTSSSDIPQIEVTVTNSDSNQVNDELKSQPADENDQHQTEPSSPSRGPNLKKSLDQEMEERILSIQSTLRTHHRHADYASALETSTELLSLSSEHFGTLHPATASAYNNVGLMNKCLGNYVEAKEAYHESLRIYGEVCGKDHASYAAAMSNLGMLERGRVLESEAEAEEDDGDESKDENSEGAEVGEFDENSDGPKPKPKLSALERMQLNESAIEYFDEAYRIRLAELGSQHPHTITSRSQLGSAMAAAVIAERKGKLSGLVEGELRQLKVQRDVKDLKEMEEYVPVAVARAAMKSSSQSKLSQRRWEAAEEHLRGALSTAVDNPRGESVSPLLYLPIGSEDYSGGNDGERQGLTLPLKKDRSLSKKDRKKAEKDRKREKRRANSNLLQSTGDAINDNNYANDANGSNERMAVQGVAGKITTLSAATAAQNLAVFLKNYSDWMRLSLVDDANNDDRHPRQQQQQKRVLINQIIQEARHLYESALYVRSKILPTHHPEVVATKFSLAELLDSPKVSLSTMEPAGEDNDGLDSARANALREEILSAYDISEREEA